MEEEIQKLNESLMHKNSDKCETKRASLIIATQGKLSKDIIPNYSAIDPYVKSILIQSVIFLDDNEFEKIKEDYEQFIILAESDPDDWVRMTAKMFKSYPEIEPSDEFMIITPEVEDAVVYDPFKPNEVQLDETQHFVVDKNKIDKPRSVGIMNENARKQSLLATPPPPPKVEERPPPPPQQPQPYMQKVIATPPPEVRAIPIQKPKHQKKVLPFAPEPTPVEHKVKASKPKKGKKVIPF